MLEFKKILLKGNIVPECLGPEGGKRAHFPHRWLRSASPVPGAAEKAAQVAGEPPLPGPPFLRQRNLHGRRPGRRRARRPAFRARSPPGTAGRSVRPSLTVVFPASPGHAGIHLAPGSPGGSGGTPALRQTERCWLRRPPNGTRVREDAFARCLPLATPLRRGRAGAGTRTCTRFCSVVREGVPSSVSYYPTVG